MRGRRPRQTIGSSVVHRAQAASPARARPLYPRPFLSPEATPTAPHGEKGRLGGPYRRSGLERQRLAAADGDDFAGDEGRIVGGEEGDSGGLVLGARLAAEALHERLRRRASALAVAPLQLLLFRWQFGAGGVHAVVARRDAVGGGRGRRRNAVDPDAVLAG